MSKIFALSLAVTAATAQIEELPQPYCAPAEVTCAAEGEECTNPEALPTGAYKLCSGGLICDTMSGNSTCIAAAMEEDACETNADCQNVQFSLGDQLECVSGACVRVTSIEPTDGCRMIGDECDNDDQCIFGECEGFIPGFKTCGGIDTDGACPEGMGCKVGAYCSADNVCTDKIANGEASDSSAWCQSGARDVDGNCADNVLVLRGGECSLPGQPGDNRVCEANNFCDGTTCMEADPNWDASTGDACTQAGDCGTFGFCKKTDAEGCVGECVVETTCRAEAVQEYNNGINAAAGDCMILPAGFGQAVGRCPASGTVRPFWEGSCDFEEKCRAQRTNCVGNFQIEQAKQAVFQGEVCGQDFSGVCGSASATTASWAVALGVAAAAYALN